MELMKSRYSIWQLALSPLPNAKKGQMPNAKCQMLKAKCRVRACDPTDYLRPLRLTSHLIGTQETP
jgi:hypothetical protein